MHCTRRTARAGCQQQQGHTSACTHGATLRPFQPSNQRSALQRPAANKAGQDQPAKRWRPTTHPTATAGAPVSPAFTSPPARQLPRSSTVMSAVAEKLPGAPSSQPSGVVIVGGGPAGLALALTLVQLHGYTDVTVLEQRPSFTFMAPDKSYVYLVDGRSRKLLDRVGLSVELDDIGVRTTSVNIARAEPDGTVKRMQSPVKDTSKVAHLMPRYVLLDLLVRAAKRQPGIRLLAGATCTAIRKEVGADGQECVVVEVQQQQQQQQQEREGQPEQQEGDGDGSKSVMATAKLTLRPQLLVGCDGHRSTVRAALAAWEEETRQGRDQGSTASSSGSSSGSSGRGRFQQTEVPCPSAGLRYKVLVLPPNPKLRSGEVLENQTFGAIAGTMKPLRLGMQPVKDPRANRTCNLITRPNHPVWDITEAEDMYRFFERCFPQLDVRALVSPERMAAYAASRGGAFPVPAYSNGCSHVLAAPGGAAGSSSATAGVVNTTAGEGAATAGCATGVLLVGDALHTFPPDLAQGVNAALEDVYVFSGVLSETGGDLGAALLLFEELRMPDVKALVHLLPLGHPYQYTQDPFKRRLWDIRFVLHMLLTKIAPWAFPLPVFMQVQDSSLSYSTILQRAKDTRARVLALLVALAAAAVAVLMRMLG